MQTLAQAKKELVTMTKNELKKLGEHMTQLKQMNNDNEKMNGDTHLSNLIIGY